ncbi:nitrilase-related carbon-nitrogen hydrolase, partial [Streptomyces sp. NPDC054841]
MESTGAELVVLPESVTTGFTPALTAEELWDLVDDVPGTLCEPLRERAPELGVHLVWGTYERGEHRGVVHNS